MDEDPHDMTNDKANLGVDTHYGYFDGEFRRGNAFLIRMPRICRERDEESKTLSLEMS